MSLWIFVVGIAVFMTRVGKYVERKKDRRLDLERLELERRTSKFWGFGTDGEDRRYKEKLAEKASWKDSAADWGWLLAGVVIWAISFALWLAEGHLARWIRRGKRYEASCRPLSLADTACGGFINSKSDWTKPTARLCGSITCCWQ
jgi:hypothetical protein